MSVEIYGQKLVDEVEDVKESMHEIAGALKCGLAGRVIHQDTSKKWSGAAVVLAAVTGVVGAGLLFCRGRHGLFGFGGGCDDDCGDGGHNRKIRRHEAELMAKVAELKAEKYADNKSEKVEERLEKAICKLEGKHDYLSVSVKDTEIAALKAAIADAKEDATMKAEIKCLCKEVEELEKQKASKCDVKFLFEEVEELERGKASKCAVELLDCKKVDKKMAEPASWIVCQCGKPVPVTTP